MEAIELAIQLITAVAKAYPVVKTDIQQMGKDSEPADKLRDALKAAKDALDALEAAVNT